MPEIRLLAIGDVVGRPGRRLIRELLPALRSRHQIDCVVANVENSAGGFGITYETYVELLNAGVDLMTSGNHHFDKPGGEQWMDRADRLIRPANLPRDAPGRVTASMEIPGKGRLRILNLLGRTFMPFGPCPFASLNDLLSEHVAPDDLLCLDFHGEATSEKQSMGWILDGKALAVWGTHTHVPTADARILPKGTGYLTDLGMTGPYHSVIGMDLETVLPGWTSYRRTKFQVAKEDPRLAGCLFTFDSLKRRCSRVQPLFGNKESLLSL